MSSNVLGAVVGGAVGFLVGGPTGALIGAGIGLAGSALVGGLGVGYDGPRLSDLSVQTSTYGADIPRVHSTIVVSGNVLWLENNKLRERVRKVSSGGKGGGSSATKEYTYYATFHLGLCEGPVAGIRRIWCSDKLLYDAGSDDLETIIANNEVARNWTFYSGSDDQLPTARYEADVGVGNATGHRGLCYIEFRDFELTDYGNTLEGAQFRVELVAVSSAPPACPVGTSLAARLPTNLGGSSVQRKMSMAYDGGTLLTGRMDAGLLFIERRRLDGSLVSLEGVGGSYQDPDTGWLYSPSFPSLNNPRSYYANRGSRNTVVVSNGTVCPIDGKSYMVAMCDAAGATYAAHGGAIRKFQNGVVAAEFRVVSGNTEFHCGLSSIDGFVYALFAGDPAVNPLVPEPGYRLYEFDDELNIINSWPGIGLFALTQGGVMLWPVARRVLRGCSAQITQPAIYSLNEDQTFTVSCIGAAGSGASAVKPDGIDQWFTPDAWFSASPPLQALTPPLSEVVQREVELSGLLSASDIDVTALTQVVKGYRVTGGSVRAALEPLAAAYQFDIIPSGYKLKAVPRGQASVLTVPYADLGATASDTPGDVFKMAREMDSQLPAKTVVKYLDAAREYDIGEQSATRINTEAVNEIESELALVLGADEAAGIAEVLQSRAWLERTDVSFTLPPTYLALEPCDVITVQTPDADYELLCSEMEYTQDGRIEVKGKPSAAAVYIPNASGGEGNTPPGTIGLAGPSLFVPLDIPVVDETVQNTPGFVGTLTGYTGGWPGGVVYRSPDNGQTWVDLQAWSAKCTIGSTPGALAEHDGYLIDQTQLNVIMISGELESITRDQLLAGYNYAAYGVDGRWEIVRFQNADVQADGSYTVSDFVRGDKGTEWATGLHQLGDWFILLGDPDNAFIGMAAELIGIDRLYRGITQRASIDTGDDVPFTYRGVNLEPLSAIDASGERDGSGNLAVEFTRRSRLTSSWWTTGVTAPVGEFAEAYEIDVLDGANVVRTITAAAPLFSYSAADQAVDFGSPQGDILFRIYQLSDVVGRGYVYEVTL